MVFVWVGLISAAFVFGERGHIAAESAAIILMMIIPLVVGTFMDPTPPSSSSSLSSCPSSPSSASARSTSAR